MELLQRKISGRTSINTFQNYVIDEFIYGLNQKELSKNNNSRINIHLFERNIDDTVYTFCNFAHQKHYLSDLEFQVLFNRAYDAQLRYKIPSYSCVRNFCLIPSTKTEDNLNEIKNIINKDIFEDGIEQRIIGLDITDEQCISRLKERGRICENKYSEEYLKEFNQFYKKLFKYLNSNDTVASIDDLMGLIN
jgi:hypothetical protein